MPHPDETRNARRDPRLERLDRRARTISISAAATIVHTLHMTTIRHGYSGPTL
jgi:hypothetical protein